MPEGGREEREGKVRNGDGLTQCQVMSCRRGALPACVHKETCMGNTEFTHNRKMI